MAAFLEKEHRAALVGVVLASLQKRSKDVTEVDLLASLSLADLIGCIRYIFDLSGGLSKVF